MDIRGLISVLVMTSLVSSCMMGPNYVRPVTVVSPEFKEAKGKKQIPAAAKNKNWNPINPQDMCDRGAWWKVFNDPVLNDLEDQLNQYNQTIVQTEAGYRQAIAVVDEARASLFPLLTGAASIFRQRQGSGATSFISTSGGTTTTGVASTPVVGLSLTSTTYSTVLAGSWEPDFWGLVRRTIEADVSAAQSDAALVALTRLSAQSSLAQFYFELRTLDRDQKFLDDTVKAYKKTLQITQNQYKSGVANRSDVVLAQAQLETTKAQALNNGILRGQYEHAIAVLMGRPPAYLNLHFMPLKLKEPIIPIAIPSHWLERRPDIAQAERLVQQTSALIGVTIAAYFPTLTLTGTGSAGANTLHHLIHTPSLGWAVGLQVAETIFDGGLRSATVRAARAAYTAQVAAYRQTVLTAFQDVEDNLIALRILREQRVIQDKAAASNNYAMKLVLNQYKAGTVNYTSVLTAQIAAFTAQKTANDVAGLQMTATVGLIKSLGGGWAFEKDHVVRVKVRERM